MAAVLVVAAFAASCSSALVARPVTIAPEAAPIHAAAVARRSEARALAEPERAAAFGEALALARRAVELAPADFRLSLLVQDLELEIDARGARERLAASNPVTAAEKTLVARSLLPERVDDARTLLLAARDDDSSFAWANYGLAFIARHDGHGDQARELCEKALQLDPTLIEALRMLTELYEASGDRARAIEARRELIEVTGGDLAERHALAQLLLEADDPDDAAEAEHELQGILAEIGDEPDAQHRGLARDVWLDFGTARARRGHNDRAIAAWRRALALDGDCLTALYNIAIVQLKQLADPRAALASFEQYLERARAMTGSLPADQLFYRHFIVPNQVLEIRQQLGLIAPIEAPTDPAEANPAEPGEPPATALDHSSSGGAP